MYVLCTGLAAWLCPAGEKPCPDFHHNSPRFDQGNLPVGSVAVHGLAGDWSIFRTAPVLLPAVPAAVRLRKDGPANRSEATSAARPMRVPDTEIRRVPLLRRSSAEYAEIHCFCEAVAHGSLLFQTRLPSCSNTAPFLFQTRLPSCFMRSPYAAGNDPSDAHSGISGNLRADQ